MTTTQTGTTQPTFEAAFDQIRELNEQLFDASRKASMQTIEAYEKAVDRAIDLERKLAGATKQEWLKTVIDAHADIAKNWTEAYTATARGILK
jgi:hypothetical protein